MTTKKPSKMCAPRLEFGFTYFLVSVVVVVAPEFANCVTSQSNSWYATISPEIPTILWKTRDEIDVHRTEAQSLSLVHTNAFSWNTYISMRLGLLSTLIRWAFSSEAHQFENALESGSKRKRVHIVLVWTVENGRESIKMKKMTSYVSRGL